MKYSREHILEALLDCLERSQAFDVPRTSDNYISAVSRVGKRETPVLYLSLANGQHFEVRAKRVAA